VSISKIDTCVLAFGSDAIVVTNSGYNITVIKPLKGTPYGEKRQAVGEGIAKSKFFYRVYHPYPLSYP